MLGRRHLWRFLSLLLITLASTSQADGADLQARYDEALKCAVYHRMVAGALKANDRGVLFEDAEELAIKGWEAAQGFGAELGMTEEELQDDWRWQLQAFNQVINFNYKNIRQLKVRYLDRCSG